MNKYNSTESLYLESTDSYTTESAQSSSPTNSELSGSESDFEQPSEKKLILVTGGAGFVGSGVAEALLKRGDEVVIVDELNDYYDVEIKKENLRLLTSVYDTDRLRVYIGDICDVEFINNVFQVEKPQWIAHMAARAGVRPSIQDPFIYVHSNVEGTTRLLQLAVEYKCQCFTYASSSSVYGGSSKEIFSESDIVDHPVSPYAASKKSCELIAHTYHHLYGLNVSGLRFFTVYGPRGRPDMAPYKFIDSVSRGSDLHQFGDGSTSRDYTYISDIVDGVVRALDRPLGYQIFNLGRGEPTNLLQFIRLVEKHVGKKANIKVLPNQPGDVPRTCADISRARRLLGYNPKISFEEGIKLTVNWYQKTKTESVPRKHEHLVRGMQQILVQSM